MIVKTEKSQGIIDFLKTDLLVNLNIIGIVENLSNIEIFVDDKENPKGVFVKKDYMHYIYSKEDSFIDEVLGTFFKEGFFGFSGVEKSIAEKIKNRFQLHWENPCGLYYMPKENLDTSLIKTDVRNIELTDAEIIDKYYEYSRPGSLDAIKSDISNRPSSAIYVNGEIASWVLVHEDNSMGIMYTVKEHRRKGYAEEVSMDLASKIIKDGKIPYLQIVERNNMSPGLAKKCGFVECGHVTWFGIIAGTPKELIEVNEKCHNRFVRSLQGEKDRSIFTIKSDYYGMYNILNNFSPEYEEVSGLVLKQAVDEDTTHSWCDVVCKGYGVFNDEIEDIKKSLMKTVEDSNYDYSLYIGILNGKPISASAILKSDEDEEDSILCLLATLPEARNKGIGTMTLAETMKKEKEKGTGLIAIRCQQKYRNIFEKSGFKISHEADK